MAEDHAIHLPFTQTDLADMLGLTAVHTNRVLQGFRQDGLITLEHRRLTLLDVERLQAICSLTRIISSSTARHLKCCGISMAWCATVADLDRQSAPRRTASCRGGSMSEGLEYGRISFEFAEEVDRLSDPDDVANSLRRIMTPFGLELYGFFARVPGPGERLDTIAFNKQIPGLAEWLKLYDDGRYAEIDPVMRRLNQTVTPFEHDEVSYDLDPRAASSSTAEGISGSQADFPSRSSARPAGMVL